ncbi:hypothetical protein TSMG0097 [Halocynthia phage JM-2012]|uniref:hypothetical protein n=1 Tax=Halocynthia phage JM-2012 TaxID=1173297 RepID=UPI00025C6935|nr:hypothetical protein TSMG0097 [Halocynthia phage JM-2012]AFI55380.1 hypothetical protein TSMG0097 [Halocynthia phage JM-2012]
MSTILNRTEVELLLQITEVDDEVIVDGQAMTLEDLSVSSVYSVNELKTIRAGLERVKAIEYTYQKALKEEREKYARLLADMKGACEIIREIPTSDWEHGHMGFPGEHVNRNPAYIRRLAAEVLESKLNEYK